MCAELCCEKPSHSRRWRLPEAFPGAPVLCKDRRVHPGRTELATQLLNRSCPKHLFPLWHHHSCASTGSAGLLCRKLHPWDSPTEAACAETSTPEQVAQDRQCPALFCRAVSSSAAQLNIHNHFNQTSRREHQLFLSHRERRLPALRLCPSRCRKQWTTKQAKQHYVNREIKPSPDTFDPFWQYQASHTKPSHHF